jgi:Transglycosylase SLT domain
MQIATVMLLLGLNQNTSLVSYMHEIAPKISETRLVYLANLIEEKSLKYDLDPFVFATIIRQESSFRRNQVNCQIRKGVQSCDAGLGQINSITAREKGINWFKAIWDEPYSLEITARMLSEFKKEFPQEPNYFGRYHDSRPKQRAEYEASLNQFLVAN